MRPISTLIFLVTFASLILASIYLLGLQGGSLISQQSSWQPDVPDQKKAALKGGVISSKMNNATIKYDNPSESTKG